VSVCRSVARSFVLNVIVVASKVGGFRRRGTQWICTVSLPR
jgi:hypothetical protein